jgi:hypothetical protein
MPFNYGGRNGVSTIITVTQKICHIYASFAGQIVAYINGSSLSPADKATVTAWLNGASAACAILETIKFNYE